MNTKYRISDYLLDVVNKINLRPQPVLVYTPGYGKNHEVALFMANKAHIEGELGNLSLRTADGVFELINGRFIMDPVIFDGRSLSMSSRIAVGLADIVETLQYHYFYNEKLPI